MKKHASPSEENPQLSLTSGTLLVRNTFWNFLGQVLPLTFALISIPLLIKAFGTDRFGILSLAWVIIGYFSLFDLGLGRTLTKIVAEKLGSGKESQIPTLVWTTLLLMLLLGILGALVLLLLSSWLVYDLLRIPVELRDETLQSLILLAASVPVVIITTGLRGILEAKQCFGLLNTIRIPLGVAMYAGPLLAIPFSHKLQPAIAILLVIRIVGLFVHLKLCFHVLPYLGKTVTFKKENIRPLFSLGGWMTVSNVVGPLMAYADRFFISTLISIAAVAYYSTPYEIVGKMTIIPLAIVGVLFPAFSTSVANNLDHTLLLYERSLKYIFIILFPITLITVTFSYDGLMLWLGPEFAKNGSTILRLLAVGVFINSFAQIPFTLIQGAGRPDITAKLHLIELPFYFVMVWLLTKGYGVEGVATAWTLRIFADAVVLCVITRRVIFNNSLKLLPHFIVLTTAVGAFVLACVVSGVIAKTVIASLLIILFAFMTWIILLKQDEKALLLNFFNKLRFLPTAE